MTNADRIARLESLAREWGGDVRRSTLTAIARPEWRGFTWCPFGQGLGVHFERKIVLYCDDETPWFHLLHEMAHIFATLVPPQYSPNELDFLGWEFLLARQLQGLKDWRRFMDNYELEDGSEFGALSRHERRAVLDVALASAVAAGLIVDGEPRSIR